MICDLCALPHHNVDCPLFHALERAAVEAGIRERPMRGSGGYEWEHMARHTLTTTRRPAVVHSPHDRKSRITIRRAGVRA